MKLLSPGLVALRCVPGWLVHRQRLNERVKLHGLKPVLRWIALVILIYLHCTRGTVLEAENADIQLDTPHRFFPGWWGLLRQNGRYHQLFYPSFHLEWAWFWTTMGEGQWP